MNGPPQVRECLRLGSTVHRVSIVDGNEPPLHRKAALETGHGGGEENDEEAMAADAGGVYVSVGKKAAAEGDGVLGGGGGEGRVLWADAVVIAVPLSLLQQGVVEFDPPLPEVRTLLLLLLETWRHQ